MNDKAEDTERYRNAGEIQVQLAVTYERTPWGTTYSQSAFKKLHGRECRLHVTPDGNELWLIVQGPTTIKPPEEEHHERTAEEAAQPGG